MAGLPFEFASLKCARSSLTGLLAVIAIVSVSPASAQIPPEQAAGKALMACVKHSAGMLSISADHRIALAGDGLAYEAEPPGLLASMKHTPYGTGEFAGLPAGEGQVWAVGYDKGTCIVMVIGTPVDPVEGRLTALFNIPSTWHAEPIGQLDAGSRWTQWSWTANGHPLTAQMKVQPLPDKPVKGLVMVTIVPASGKK